MGYIEIDFWEIPLYVSVVVLLCVTVLYLLKERTDRKKNILEVYTRGKFGEFNEEIHSQSFKLQVEKALESISNTIDRERLVLQELFENGKMESMDKGLLLEKQNRVTGNFYKKNGNDLEGEGSTNGPIPLKEVTRLADLEMSAGELFDTPEISKGEMLLMEKLNKYAENPNYREKKDTGQNLPMERLGGIETFE
jgi:hypothetical protein